MLKVGLTGGIATGKSTVLRIFEELGAVVIDSDQVAKSFLQIPSPCYFQIVAKFGTHILKPGSSYEIDRAKLANIIFTNPEKKNDLTAIIHPAVYQSFMDVVALNELSRPDAIIVYESAILFDTILVKEMDTFVVTTCDRELQIKRAMARDNSTIEQVESRMAAQSTRHMFYSGPMTFIDTNDESLVRQQVVDLYRQYRAV